jgi:hypothetical protein
MKDTLLCRLEGLTFGCFLLMDVPISGCRQGAKKENGSYAVALGTRLEAPGVRILLNSIDWEMLLMNC